MSTLYFAYGSNLRAERLRTRVPSARPAGVARIDGYRLALDKRGADGSAKANLVADAGAAVWGALYALDPAELPRLDRAEGGYARIRVEALLAVEEARPGEGARRPAWTYASERRIEDRRALPGYRRLILEGAAEHGLPAHWQERLAELPVRPEPSAGAPGGARG